MTSPPDIVVGIMLGPGLGVGFAVAGGRVAGGVSAEALTSGVVVTMEIVLVKSSGLSVYRQAAPRIFPAATKKAAASDLFFRIITPPQLTAYSPRTKNISVLCRSVVVSYITNCRMLQILKMLLCKLKIFI